MDNALFLVLFVLVLFVGSLLFYKASGNLLYPSVIMLFYWHYLVFAYVGTAILFFSLNETLVNRGVTNYILLWKVWGSSAAGFIIIPSVLILFNKFSILHTSISSNDNNVELGYNRLILIFLTIVSVIVLLFYLRQLPNIPILSIVSSLGTDELILLRSDATTGFTGKLHWYNLLLRSIVPFLSYISFFEFLKKRTKLFFLLFGISVFSAIVSLQKAPLILYLSSLIFAYYLFYKKQISKRVIVVFSFIFLGLLIVMYIFFMGYDVNSKGINKLISAPFYRALSSQIAPLYSYFEMFPGYHDFLYGSSFPNPGNILPFENYRLTVEVMNYIKPELALKGVVGSAPTVFFGEIYANFAEIGMAVSMIIVGIILYLIYSTFERMPKNFVSLALNVWFSFHISKLAMTGFSSVFMGVSIFGVIFVSMVIFFLSNLIDKKLSNE